MGKSNLTRASLWGDGGSHPPPLPKLNGRSLMTPNIFEVLGILALSFNPIQGNKYCFIAKYSCVLIQPQSVRVDPWWWFGSKDMIKISDEIPKYSITRNNTYIPSKTKSIFTCSLCKARSVSHAKYGWKWREETPALRGRGAWQLHKKGQWHG